MKRRMFSDDITSSGKFLRLSLTAQALYLHLGMNADDDGVVEAFSIMRLCGAKEDDLVLLNEREFVTMLDQNELIIWITSWQDFNKIASHIKEDSKYLPLLLAKVEGLEVVKSTKKEDNKRRYAQLREQRKQSKSDDPNMILSGSSRITSDDPTTKVRLGKDRIEVLSNDNTQAEVEPSAPEKTRETFLEGMKEDTKEAWLFWENHFAEITTSLAENRAAINKLLERDGLAKYQRLVLLAEKAWSEPFTQKEVKVSSPALLEQKRAILLTWGKGKFKREQETNHHFN